MVFIALLLFIVGFVAWRAKAQVGFPLSKNLTFVHIASWALGAVLLAGSMAVIVEPGNAGVVVIFGRVHEESLPSGLHFVNPFAQVIPMEIKTRNYTMSNVAEEGQKRGDDSIAVISSDGLTLKLDATVFYSLRPEKVSTIYRTIGVDVEERIVRSEIRAALRDTAAGLSATELYTSKRMAFMEAVTKSLRTSMETRGLTLEQVLLRNVILPDQITKAINEKIAADQEAQRMVFVLNKEKQEAERKRIEAEGQARAQQIVSASLTPQILEYQRIQALRYVGEKGNLIITGGGATPLIQVPSKK